MLQLGITQEALLTASRADNRIQLYTADNTFVIHADIGEGFNMKDLEFVYSNGKLTITGRK